MLPAIMVGVKDGVMEEVGKTTLKPVFLLVEPEVSPVADSSSLAGMPKRRMSRTGTALLERE